MVLEPGTVKFKIGIHAEIFFDLSHDSFMCFMTLKGPDYMRPVQTQTGTTSDRSPYKCLLGTVFMKPV